MVIDPQIFKAYDIRGVYPNQINEELAYRLGRALVMFLRAKQIVVGRDMRLSSSALAECLIRGIIDSGTNVINIGLTSAPMFYFAVFRSQANGGIMVTASHLPKEFNGFKLVRKKGEPISQDSGLIDIQKAVLENKFAASVKKGELFKKDVLDDYIEDIFQFIKTEEIDRLKIVADAGNGMAGLILPKFFEKLKCLVSPLFWEIDGNFPNRPANPLPFENSDILRKTVIKEGADLGIGFDGDADRVIFINEKGEGINPDFVTAFLTEIILTQHPGQKILIDVRSSRVIKETIEKNGGQVVFGKCGHSFIKEQMKKQGIVFAGEHSGHYYFQESNNFESPFLVILYLLKTISRQKKKIPEIFKPFEKYYALEQLDFRVKDRQKIMNKIEQLYSRGKISRLDGLSVEFPDWWFNLRLSQTEPVLRLNLEAKSKKLMEEKVIELSYLIKGEDQD